jgi:LmbE family N-acetylglucosaminyl deacetylase
MIKLRVALCISILAIFLPPAPRAQEAISPRTQPDSRYKVDILIIVGHPDDETEVNSYVAKLIEEQHKQVAVVFATRGNSGGNAAGPEQAAVLADVREMESRHSMASYGITNAWYLHGSDTPGGDVLHSLESWGHGTALDEVVRLVRLTRPEIIFTWLPNYVVGENHDDHQAAGVLATEAFDLAANPLAFPEQVTAARDPLSINNYGEGLRPWQPKKIYYFSDATHFDFYKGRGPEYQTSDISPSRKIPYSLIAAEAWRYYKTQNDYNDAQLKEATETPIRLILGKSLVGGTATGDVFEGIAKLPIGYVAARGYQKPPAQLSLELGGPWAFYREFWPAHNIDFVADLFTPEAQVAPKDTLWVPLLIRNDTDSPKNVTLQAVLPTGWTQTASPQQVQVEPHDVYAAQLTIRPSESQKDSWQSLKWIAKVDGQEIGSVTLRVSVAGNGLPQ